MNQRVLFLAFAGVLAVPGGASAFFRCCWAPPPCVPYGYGSGYGYGPGYAYGAPIFPRRFAPPYYEATLPPLVYPAFPPAIIPRAAMPGPGFAVPIMPPSVTVIPSVSVPMVMPLRSDSPIQPAGGSAVPPTITPSSV